jgi:FKBP-type peptidyl-prolyl cis-trans isomerase
MSGEDPAETMETTTQEECRVPLNYTPSPQAEDISPLKNGLLYKEQLRQGEYSPGGDWGACEGMEVKVHYIGLLTDGTEFDKSNLDADPFSFTIGEGRSIK